jgi:hypothetical protein
MPIAARLTASAPEREFDVPRLAAPPRVLSLTVAKIRNAPGQAFSLACTAAGPPDAAIGTVTPYPPERGGTFTLSVPPAAARLLSPEAGRGKVRLTLTPIAADRPLAPSLEVTVSELAWR